MKYLIMFHRDVNDPVFEGRLTDKTERFIQLQKEMSEYELTLLAHMRVSTDDDVFLASLESDYLTATALSEALQKFYDEDGVAGYYVIAKEKTCGH